MNISHIVRAEKDGIDISDWKQGNISKNYFPCSKAKSQKYKYGQDYSWCVIKFLVDETLCRVLVIFNPAKEIMSATLAVESEGDVHVLCVHEFHAIHRHPGWHCHLTWKDHQVVGPGYWRGRLRRWPSDRAPHKRRTFGLSRDNVLAYVRELFQIREQTRQGRLL